MRNSLLIVLSMVFLASCKKKDSIPRNILPQKKMQAILWDMMRADQFLTDYVLNRDTSLNKEKESFKYYQQVFAIHKIDKDEFQRSFAFYRSHPALLKAIMDSISAPQNTLPVVAQPEQPTTPLAVPDTATKVAPSLSPDTLTPRRKRLPAAY